MHLTHPTLRLSASPHRVLSAHYWPLSVGRVLHFPVPVGDRLASLMAAACAVTLTLVLSATTQAADITLDGTSGSNMTSANYSTDGGLNINLGFFTEYLIVGGGGGGGNGNNGTNGRGGGGGGAGGLLTNVGGTLLQVTAGSHSVVVGAGGAAGVTQTAGSSGGKSSFFGIEALGGGGGGGASGGNTGKAGGSGGGGAGAGSVSGLGGLGTPGQGNNGGNGDRAGAGFGGGGGGAGQAGRNGQNSTAVRGGYGGDGLQNDITGINLYYAGGGGGRDSGGTNADSGEGGLGGGGDAAQPGTDGLGGGGGGGTFTDAQKGGSGVVVVRYAGAQAGTGGAISTVGGDTVHHFLGSSALDLSGLDLNARLGVTLAGQITGSGDLTYNGPGRLTLAANNTYSGATTINVGTLQAGIASVANVSGALGNNSAVTLANIAGATLDLDGYDTQIGSLTGGGVLGGNVTLSTATLTVGGDDTSPAPYAGAISGTGGLTKIGTGTQTLAGANTYGGTTTVTGGTLKVSGTHTGGGAYAIGAGTTLVGTGTIGSTIGGAGLASPGNSPGILTVAQVDPSGGMDFGFEFMGASPTWSNAALSVNDVLRITDPTTPFTMGPMDTDNVVSIYLNVASLADNDTFDGGFFTDRDLNFLAEVGGADYDFYVLGDGLGADATFMGNDYYSLANFAALNMLTISLAVGVVQVPTADFDGPDVTNGWVTRFTADVAGINDAVVPEPASIAVWAIFGLGLAALGACRLRRKQ